MKNKTTALLSTALVMVVGLGCSKLASVGSNGNMLEGTNAKAAIEKIKSKIGAADLKVIRAEVHNDKVSLTIQAPDNPKNIDQYTYEKGSVTGPEPVKVFDFGSGDMTGDRYHTTSVDEIDWAAIPGAIEKAKALSKVEDPKVGLISMDHQKSTTSNPTVRADRARELDQISKELSDKRNECKRAGGSVGQCLDGLNQLEEREKELRFNRGNVEWEFTWRIFVDGPRGRRNFWADKKGNVNEDGF